MCKPFFSENLVKNTSNIMRTFFQAVLKVHSLIDIASLSVIMSSDRDGFVLFSKSLDMDVENGDFALT